MKPRRQVQEKLTKPVCVQLANGEQLSRPRRQGLMSQGEGRLALKSTAVLLSVVAVFACRCDHEISSRGGDSPGTPSRLRDQLIWWHSPGTPSDSAVPHERGEEGVSGELRYHVQRGVYRGLDGPSR